MTVYVPASDRYEQLDYARCGRSGLKLPKLSLGLWQNFGETNTLAAVKSLLFRAFDLGITHFDLANNYGPPPGAAEINFGKVLKESLGQYRDELVISTKAGYPMWAGPYGNWGSRKYLLSSLDQSLKRLEVDYVDIFYSHRPDPDTPLMETMSALDQAVRSGKALYAGISNYPAEETLQASKILKQLGTPCLIHQPRYNMFDRWVEKSLFKVLREEGIGCIVFSPLAQGLLTNRYLRGTPEDSRVGLGSPFLRAESLTPSAIEKARLLDFIATERGQTLAQMSITWICRNPEVTSVLIGASKVSQVDELVRGLHHPLLTPAELEQIEHVLG